MDIMVIPQDIQVIWDMPATVVMETAMEAMAGMEVTEDMGAMGAMGITELEDMVSAVTKTIIWVMDAVVMLEQADMTVTVTGVDTVRIQIMVQRMHPGARITQTLLAVVVMVHLLLIRLVIAVIPKHTVLCMFLQIQLFVINVSLST